MKKHKRKTAERLAEGNPERKQMLNGLLVGVRPGTVEWREARRRYVMVWRLAGRDKWSPNYGKGSRGKKISKEAEALRRKLMGAMKK